MRFKEIGNEMLFCVNNSMDNCVVLEICGANFDNFDNF